MTALVGFGNIISLWLLLAVSSIANGYVLSVFWGWFVIPVFGAPTLGIVPATGIAGMVHFMTYQTNESKNVYVTYTVKDHLPINHDQLLEEIERKEEDDNGLGAKIAKGCINGLALNAFILFWGWIVHLFM